MMFSTPSNSKCEGSSLDHLQCLLAPQDGAAALCRVTLSQPLCYRHVERVREQDAKSVKAS